MEDNKNKKEEKITLNIQTKIKLWISMIYGVIMLFGCVGLFVEPLLAEIIILVTCVTYVMTLIITDAGAAYFIWRLYKKNKPEE